MFDSKIIKTIWAMNGILLLIALLFATFKIITELPFIRYSNSYETGAIVGDLAERAKDIDFDLQHLMYDSPEKIKYSDYFLIEIIVLDKELSNEQKTALTAKNDFSIRMIGAPVNVVFYNSSRSDIHKLLDNYGFIERIDFPKDSYYGYDREEKYKRDFILYELAFKDTNGDERINEKDSTAFFISDLAGKNLKQITPFSLDFDKYTFSNDYSEIYFEKVEKHESKDILGHFLKSRKIYFYNIKSGKLDKFKKLEDMLSTVKENFKL